MKVIGVGTGRTGTLSLKMALEELGFDPCYHMRQAVFTPSHNAFWEAAWAGEDVDWIGFFADYDAGVDLPTCLFAEKFMDIYPEAKFVLTVRDADRWYESSLSSIYDMFSRPALAKIFVPPYRVFWKMTNAIIWGEGGIYEGRFEDRDFAIGKFHEHNEAMKTLIPSDRLLVFSVKEGWGPLCDFLGVDAPGGPFPHANDRVTMKRQFNLIRAVSYLIPVVVGLVVAGIGFGLWRLLGG